MLASVCWSACTAFERTTTAGFWFGDDVGPLPPDVTARLNGPLTRGEMDQIAALAREEIHAAFAGLRITFISSSNAFWRVRVSRDLPYRGEMARTGESLPLGPLGGLGEVDFSLVVRKAIEFAPADASRAAIVDAVGRGVGRVAVHEFFHQIAGPSGQHNNADPDSYESGSSDRASQYYGRLHWTTGWPLIQKRLG